MYWSNVWRCKLNEVSGVVHSSKTSVPQILKSFSILRKAARLSLYIYRIKRVLRQSLSNALFIFVSSRGETLQLTDTLIEMPSFGSCFTNECLQAIVGLTKANQVLFDWLVAMCVRNCISGFVELIIKV